MQDAVRDISNISANTSVLLSLIYPTEGASNRRKASQGDWLQADESVSGVRVCASGSKGGYSIMRCAPDLFDTHLNRDFETLAAAHDHDVNRAAR